MNVYSQLIIVYNIWVMRSSCSNDKRTKNYPENRYERHHCCGKDLSSSASQGMNKIKNKKNNKPTQTAAGITGE